MTRGQVIVTCLLTVVATLLTANMLGVGPDDDKKQGPTPTEVLIIGTPMDYDLMLTWRSVSMSGTR